MRFVTEVTGPLNGPADRVGCRLENGTVRTPDRLQGRPGRSSSSSASCRSRCRTTPAASAVRTPSTVVLQELQSGANTAFNMYPGLTHGAADVIADLRAARGQGALPAAACSTDASRAPCASPSRTPAPTSAPPRRGRSTSRATSTPSPAPSAGSRRATTTWPRTSSTSCSPASRARRPAPRACRSSSSRRSG